MSILIAKLLGCAFSAACDGIGDVYNELEPEEIKIERQKKREKIYLDQTRCSLEYMNILIDFIDNEIRTKPEFRNELKKGNYKETHLKIYWRIKKSKLCINFSKTVNGKNWSKITGITNFSLSGFVHLVAAKTTIKYFPEKYHKNTKIIGKDNYFFKDINLNRDRIGLA